MRVTAQFEASGKRLAVKHELGSAALTRTERHNLTPFTILLLLKRPRRERGGEGGRRRERGRA